MVLITRNSVLRRAEEPRLEMLQLRTSIWPDWCGGGVNACESYQRLFGVETAYISNLGHEPLGRLWRPQA